MSDEQWPPSIDAETAARLDNPAPPTVDVGRPDIPPPKRDSMGRSMAKRRGKAPLPRDEAGNIIRDSTSQLKTELKHRLPKDLALSDANVGKALAGAFAAIGLFRGGHWRLFAQEEAQLGECFGPLARIYGPEELGKWVTVLMTVPVVTGILMPRIAVERMVIGGTVDKAAARSMLLQVSAFTEAEKSFNMEREVKEAQAYLKAQAQAAVDVSKDMHNTQTAAEGVIPNA